MADASHDQLASVVRQHAGQLAAALMRVTGDFATAKDLVQDAVLAALQHWPAGGSRTGCPATTSWPHG